MADRKLRICYVLNRFGVGGAEAVALDLARGHDPERFEVEVLAAIEPRTQGEPEMRRRFREAGVRTRVLYQDNLRSPLALLRLAWALRRGSYDIVHGHNRGSDYWAARLASLVGIPHRFWTRHLVYRDMTPKQIRRYSSLADRIDGVLAVSETVRKACIETERMPGHLVHTVVNGIDLDRFRPRDEAANRAKLREIDHPEGEAALLFVGRFSDQKAPEAFIALLRRLREQGRPVRGYLCGHGPLAGKLEDLAAASDGAARILGLRSDIPELLAACDLFVSTSRNEGLPLNVMEAMAAGSAFVAPGIPQIRELVAGDELLTGQLYEAPPPEGEVPDRLIEQWSDGVVRSLEDPDRLDRLGRAGRERIDRDFSLDHMVAEYERHFEAAVAARRGD